MSEVLVFSRKAGRFEDLHALPMYVQQENGNNKCPHSCFCSQAHGREASKFARLVWTTTDVVDSISTGDWHLSEG